MEGALQTKTGVGGVTPSDDLFMRGDGRLFGDDNHTSLWQRIEYGNIFGYFIDRSGT